MANGREVSAVTGPERIGAMIRRAREQAGMTQLALAAALGCSKAQVSLMESGQRTVSRRWAAAVERALGLAGGTIIRAMEMEHVSPDLQEEVEASRALAERLRQAAARGESLDALFTSGQLARLVERSAANVDAPRPLGRRIPVINRVAAGQPIEFTDMDYPVSIADDYISCPDVTDPQAFATRVVGDSMEPQYREGEIVVFSPEAPTPAGSDCFVRLVRDNEMTFKRVYFENDGRTIRLQPLNRRYPPRMIDREDVAAMYAAVYVMRRVEPVGE